MQMQYFTAGDQQFQLKAHLQQFTEQGCCSDYLLKVVEHQQELLVLQVIFQEIQERSVTHFSECQSLSDGGNNQSVVADGSEWDEIDPIGKAIEQVSGDVQGEAGFAHTSRTGQRQQAYFRPSQERSRARRIVLASNQWGKWYGKTMFRRWLRLAVLFSSSVCRWKGGDSSVEALQAVVS